MKTDRKQARRENLQFPYYGCLLIVFLMVVMGLGYSYVSGMKGLSLGYVRDVSIDIVGMIMCGGFLFSLAMEKNKDYQNRAFFRLVFTLCVLFHCDLASSFMEGNTAAVQGVKLINTLIYIFEGVLVYCFVAYIRDVLQIRQKKLQWIKRICRSIFFIDLIFEILNYKFGFYFTVSADALFVAGKYDRISDLITFLLYLIAWYLILSDVDHPRKEKAILMLFQICPIMGHLYGVVLNEYVLVYPTYLLAIMMIYINVFAIRGQKILEQEVELDQKRIALMISQIQPHFLYNVLTTISNLCVTDPEEAEETTDLFSQYLRTNLDSLRKTEPVPFRVELGHIQTYIELEKKRFQDMIIEEIDCTETGFLVPSLGLQPIVENSIKHGIRGKDTPGHLWITSKKVNGGFEVVIADDGVGFDQNALPAEDGRSHVGMENVRTRLEKICDASVKVESSPGNGCKTTVFFPERS